MSKSTSPDREARISGLNYKRDLIEKFISLRDLAESNPNEMIKEYLGLLEEVRL
mgnify:CR=1 FL=1